MIGETVSGIHEVHANASFNLENRRYAGFVDRLSRVRVVWNLYKYAIKVSNNFFQSLGPFVLFLVGGYLAINGRFDLGALVAFLSANEKLYDPWKELMDFYQVYQDAPRSATAGSWNISRARRNFPWSRTPRARPWPWTGLSPCRT